MMISSRTPLRISFFGGGTDYPQYFERHRGAVVGMAIDRYIYINLLRSTSFLDFRFRVSYSKLEMVNRVDDIMHPVVRAVLNNYGLDRPLDISIQSDIPASTGLGSSSSFTVGFINLIAHLQSLRYTKLDLARQAINIERNVLHESVGVQDQLHAAFGGINRFDFEKERIRITPLYMTGACQELLCNSLLLIYTGITRHASATVDEQLKNTEEKKLDKDLEHLIELTDQAVEILESKSESTMLKDLGALLHEGWMIKRRFSSKVTNPKIDEIYQFAMDNGALGGKLCGAGGGGFLLMIVPPGDQERFLSRHNGSQVVKVGLDVTGSTVIYS